MNTSIRNILREGLILEASKKQILIQKVGWNEESADILDRLCGPLSVLIGNKIIEYKIEDMGKFPDGASPQDIKKVIMDDLNYNRFVFLNRQRITSIMDWIRVGLNGNLGENKNLSFKELYYASEKWHDELEVGQGDINYTEENPIILDFRDDKGHGFYWADLETNSSKEECNRMGHCGTSGAGGIYSLRQVIPLSDKYTLNKSVLTAAIGSNGIVYQMKGGKNSKPEAKFHKFIYPLLFLKKSNGDYFIDGFGSEYDSSSDFKLTDFSDDVIKEIFVKRPELFNKRSLKKKLVSMGLIDKLPEEYVNIEIDVDNIQRYVDSNYSHVIKTVLSGDDYDLWDNYDADWKSALEYYVNEENVVEIKKMLRSMAAKNGVEIDESLSLEELIEEYDEDQEIINAIQLSVNDAERDDYISYIYKKLKESLEEYGGVERLDDTGVSLRVDLGKLIDELEDEVYEEIADNCNDESDCIFNEMISDGWIDKPDFYLDDRYYPDVNNDFFNEMLRDRLGEVSLNESKVAIKNMLRENFVRKVVNEVSDDVYDLVSTKYANSRIIVSPENSIKFRTKSQQEKGYKPHGLWYGIGTSWMDFVKSELYDRDYGNVFKIDIDESKMKIIRNYKELLEFEKEYSTDIEGMGGFNKWSIYIDWVRVAEDYSGIEIAPYLYEARMKHMWYYGWDVASGCIWGKGVIKNITKIS